MVTTLRRAVALLVLVGWACAARAEEASPASTSYAQGQALLAQGDLDGAAQAFLEAARAAPGRPDYVEKATLLRRMRGLRRVVEQGAEGPTWDQAVASLHLFYLQSGLPRLAVEVDRKAHERRPSAETAAPLAEALLAAGEDASVTTLAAPYTAASRRLTTYYAIALARLGYEEEAKRQVERFPPSEDATPADRYDRARALALLHRPDEAIASLVASLERSPAVAVPALKERARAERDFAGLAALPAFEKALRTESKQAATCSGGSSCSGCPNRGSCGGAKR